MFFRVFSNLRLMFININNTAIDCIGIVTHICHPPYGCRHVVPSVISLAGVYLSPAKPGALAGVQVLPAPTGWPSRLSADIRRDRKLVNNM